MTTDLVYQLEGTIITNRGYEISLHLKLWKHSNKRLPDFPEGYQFNWIAFNIVNPTNEFVLFDNHNQKPPHYHIDDKKKSTFFTWISRSKAEKLFWQKVQEKFGYFELDWE